MWLVGQSKDDHRDEQVLPFLRLTVLGSADSGKTGLINSWVNNTCPSAYVPTEEATLYYRTMRIENPNDPGENKDIASNLVSVLVEVEDTFSWDPQKCRSFLDLTPVRPVSKHKRMIGGTAVALADFSRPSRTEYTPMSRARMGFLVVFDANRPESWETAREIYDELCRSGTDKAVFLVANKIDKDPYSPTFRGVVEAARKHAKLVEVSAMEFTRVRKLFRDIVEDIILHPELWSEDGQGLKAPEPPQKSAMDQIGLSTEDCSVQ